MVSSACLVLLVLPNTGKSRAAPGDVSLSHLHQRAAFLPGRCLAERPVGQKCCPVESAPLEMGEEDISWPMAPAAPASPTAAVTSLLPALPAPESGERVAHLQRPCARNRSGGDGHGFGVFIATVCVLPSRRSVQTGWGQDRRDSSATAPSPTGNQRLPELRAGTAVARADELRRGEHGLSALSMKADAGVAGARGRGGTGDGFRLAGAHGVFAVRGTAVPGIPNRLQSSSNDI